MGSWAQSVQFEGAKTSFEKKKKEVLDYFRRGNIVNIGTHLSRQQSQTVAESNG